MSHWSLVKKVSQIQEWRYEPNGLTVLHKPMHHAPVVGIMVTYCVGSRHESRGNTGAAHLLEHLMFKGSKHFNNETGKTIDKLEDYGAILNATTWLDRTNYYTVLPKKYAETALIMEADRMRNALLNQEDLDVEMTVVRNEYEQGENSAVSQLQKHLWAQAYHEHGYQHPTIGWKADIENTNVKQLREFYDQYYWPNQAVLTVFGDIRTEELHRYVETAFGAVQPNPSPPPPIWSQESKQEGIRHFELNRYGHPGCIAWGYKIPEVLHEDFLALDVLAHVLGAKASSRLHRSFVNEGLAKWVYADAQATHDPGLFVIIVALTDGIDHEQATKRAEKLIQDLINGGIEKKELHHAIVSSRASMVYMQDNIQSQLNLINEAIAGGDWSYPFTIQDRLEQITVETVKEVARKYLQRKTLTRGWFIPKKEGDAS